MTEITDKLFENFLYGGDYNPEQWPENTWQDDIDKLKLAHINVVTINVFSWTLLESKEGLYDFTMIDKIVRLLKENSMKIIMATSTAALPFWMVKKYPDVSRVDENKIRQGPGKRHNACPNSPNFIRKSKDLVRKLAIHFKENESIICWHISNEYGGYCYCDKCAIEFRNWLIGKYQTLNNLNTEWNTNYWNHVITDWDEIYPPTKNNDIYVWKGSNYPVSMSCVLDYNRFQSDSLLKEYNNEYRILRENFRNTPITTNLMALQPYLDYNKWAKHLDVISWDNYPKFNTSGIETGFEHDLMYGFKNQPFLLMEQSPTQQNWNTMLKQPGQMRMFSYQAIAHGANSIQFFQMKQSRNGIEQYHGGVISHSLRTDTRSFNEITELGEELKKLSNSGILTTKKETQVALLFDWDNYWANNCLEDIPRRYIDKCLAYYKALVRRGINVDVISPQKNLTKYEIIVAPYSYIISRSTSNKIQSFVENGGSFISGPMSGMVNENNNVYMGGYPGALKNVLGIWVEEFDIPNDKTVTAIFKQGDVQCRDICDVIHLENAKSFAVYGPGKFYSGMPVVTKNNFGQGTAYHIGSNLSDVGLNYIIDDALREHNIQGSTELIPNDVDVTTRENNTNQYHFFINTTGGSRTFQNPYPGTVEIITGKKSESKVTLSAYSIIILKTDLVQK